MTNSSFATIDEFRDIESLNYFRQATTRPETDPEAVLASIRSMGRDNARTPMQWDDGPNGGFTTGRPWIEVNPNTGTINAAGQVGRDGSVFEWYRRLIELRHRDRLVSHGRFTMLAPDHPVLFAYLRTLGDRQLLVLANPAPLPFDAAPELPDADSWRGAAVVLDNWHGGGGGDPLRLAAWQVRVLERRVG